MAKGSRGKNSSNTGRDARPSALTVTLRSRPPLPLDRVTENLKAPAAGPARTFRGVAGVGVEKPRKKSPQKFTKMQLAFTAPAETLVCVRRSRRKEVLHALKKTGKGGQRKPRRSRWRHVKC